MAFCTNCGKKIRPYDKFCPNCGKPTSQASFDDQLHGTRQPLNLEQETTGQRKQVFEGSVHKCPNCGEVIEAFTLRCPSCGLEFRDAQAPSAVREFARKLEEIESHRKEKGVASSVMDALGIVHLDSADEQKISLIRSFSVPNTKEDVLEFLILASSNINETIYKGDMKSSERSVSDAWMAKAQQVYYKAQMTFADDPEFSAIKDVYEKKMKAVNWNKTYMLRVVIGMIALMVAMILLGIFYENSSSSSKDVLTYYQVMTAMLISPMLLP